SKGFDIFSTSDTARQSATVAYLATALAVEKDPIIRDAILDVFSELHDRGVDLAAINEGLAIAIMRNLKLSKSVEIGDNRLEVIPVTDPRIAPLQATAKAIVTLIRQGATVKNFSGIYCAQCDFSGAEVDLSHANFDEAILIDANFSKTQLANASFDGATIF